MDRGSYTIIILGVSTSMSRSKEAKNLFQNYFLLKLLLKLFFIFYLFILFNLYYFLFIYFLFFKRFQKLFSTLKFLFYFLNTFLKLF